MASTIKKSGKTGSMLSAMTRRGGKMLSDHPGFPPAKVFFPLRHRGLVELSRETRGPKTRYSIWHLTAKGWAALGLPVPASAEKSTL